ncbi:hypothetical protein PHYPSEUDO_013053 [Phytophthora pseudosyringae]|uniref:AB hydrolase-1 domain-containing protein n=1 Tax=Phytophthora pseudosyringae TaxID=221518 RepID=A0A8T1W7F1_9STRA|nr:hypothetical protein PHYPSEUDO_013053 [Phytophthora pseudosyringae]
MSVANVHYTVLNKFAHADGVDVFYREAGDRTLPTLLLLHGYPTSSLQFRELIPLLADKYHIIAPDFPSFGFTQVPTGRNYVYTFDNLGKTLVAFVDELQLKKYALYIFDYGAPVGLRLALAYPERVTGLVSQNGNAYEEGLGDAWDPVRAFWADPSPANRKVVHDSMLNLEGTRWQYTHGVPASKLERIGPETYWLDTLLFERAGGKDIQLDLCYDYQNNMTLYPEFQKFFRATQVPSLVIWGKHDEFFVPAGAEAFKRDNPKAVVELLDAGHFALETDVEFIAQRIREVLDF